ncbi:lanthionine synthetase LanC family protein [Chitinophaga filiformis]|uniref:non-specific serine/threonine protein kinase n=1 Tax=Chitinophaga filiformis TaxID=104663 RepID=A0ABY4HYN7_CHIFI|nr:lanthionine synthetase LanC family protein [Chitinophaga filiformis]UPK68048.1 protein kinase [Chitinophaga filiformis]
MITDNDNIIISNLRIEREYSALGYTEILEKFRLRFAEDEKFLKVNQRPHKGGWVLYMSVVVTEIEALLVQIVPYLAKTNLSFDVAKSPAIVRALFAGFYGYDMIGKIITIYPDENDICQLAATLIKLTSGFRGPIIPTAFHIKGLVHANIVDNSKESNVSTNGMDTAATDCINVPGVLVARQLTWPFISITAPPAIKKQKILAKRYLIDKILKNDAKGRVMKVLDLRSLRYRVVKEGIKYMSYDYAGRDVTDRLLWQFEMHKRLSQIIPAPDAYALFEESGNYYLVIDFKKGMPLSQYIDESYALGHCSTLPSDVWENILNALKSILLLLIKLHSNGYIFRDVNPRNFLIDRPHCVTCTDFELTYHIDTGKPSPPFELGTPGYMSPEQNEGATPTVQQDIYGVGGLMVRCLTGISPMAFDLDNIDALRKQLSFHMGPNQASLVSQCFSPVAEHRPTLSGIAAAVNTWPNNYFSPAMFNMGKPNPEQVRSVIQHAIAGLTSRKVVNSEKLWVSKSSDAAGIHPNEVAETVISPDLYQGIGGIIYLLMDAKSLGFDLSPCKGVLEANFNYLFNHYVNNTQIANTGLFYGMEGNALLALKAINLQWVTSTPEILKAIRRSTGLLLPELNLETGSAGIGIILIEVCKIFQEDWPRQALDSIIHRILEQQCKDGSWRLNSTTGSIPKDIDFSFFTGVSGIIYFLLKAYQYKKSDTIILSAMRGLEYLIKSERRRRSRQIKAPWIRAGIAGAAIPFLQAYGITQETKLRKHVEKLLRKIPNRLNAANLGFSSGLAGVGEVYLQAANVASSQEWMERADWITNYVLHRAIHDSGEGLLWATDTSGVFTGSLMTGNGAIIHYLLRYLRPDKITYPIF